MARQAAEGRRARAPGREAPRPRRPASAASVRRSSAAALDVALARHHHEQRARRSAAAAASSRAVPGQARRARRCPPRRALRASLDHGAELRERSEPGGRLTAAGCARRSRWWSGPARARTRTTRPPAASTSSRPTICVQPPSRRPSPARRAGAPSIDLERRVARRRPPRGRPLSSASSVSARSASGTSGRPRPLRRAHRRVGVDRRRRARRPRARAASSRRDVAGVQQVEAAVGEAPRARRSRASQPSRTARRARCGARADVGHRPSGYRGRHSSGFVQVELAARGRAPRARRRPRTPSGARAGRRRRP